MTSANGNCVVCGEPVTVTGEDAEEVEAHPRLVQRGLVHFDCLPELKSPREP